MTEQANTEIAPQMGKPGEPVAELTHFGWTLMSFSWRRTRHPKLITKSFADSMSLD